VSHYIQHYWHCVQHYIQPYWHCVQQGRRELRLQSFAVWCGCLHLHGHIPENHSASSHHQSLSNPKHVLLDSPFVNKTEHTTPWYLTSHSVPWHDHQCTSYYGTLPVLQAVITKKSRQEHRMPCWPTIPPLSRACHTACTRKGWPTPTPRASRAFHESGHLIVSAEGPYTAAVDPATAHRFLWRSDPFAVVSACFNTNEYCF
jgi:hypothetical protein